MTAWDAVSALAVLAAMTCACAGYGCAVLRLLGLEKEFPAAHAVTAAFAVGFGVLGWLMFPLGTLIGFGAGGLWAVIALGAAGLVFARSLRWEHAAEDAAEDADTAAAKTSWLFRLGLIVLVVLVGFKVLEACAPPTDSDSLAYHFTLPKQFLAAGEITFTPHALTAAIPLLVQSTYVPALGLGGEWGLTGWMLVTSLFSSALLYALCRRYMDPVWSLGAVLVWMSTPAVVYGAGSGQVEVRIAMFVMLAAWAVGRALETNQARYAVLAGLMAGFFGGAKYTGPIFMLAALLVLLAGQGWFRRGLMMGLAALAAAFPWYLWNWINTGDPMFPLLFSVFGVNDPAIWNAEHDAYFRAVNAQAERPFDINIWSWLTYPFIATFAPPAHIESGRTGLGPYAVVMLLPALWAVWIRRGSIGRGPARGNTRRGPAAAGFVIAVLFFAVAFFLEGPQRVRHLLPVWPLVIIALTAAAAKICAAAPARRAVLTAMAAVIALQSAGAAVFAGNFFNPPLSAAARRAFIDGGVSYIQPVRWVNENLGPDAVFVTAQRTQLYYLDVPHYFAHALDQAVLPWFSSPPPPPPSMARGLARIGATHVLKTGGDNSSTAALREAGCLRTAHTGEAKAVGSRTLKNQASVDYVIYAFNAETCALLDD
ncbi:MAG: glycosyltransferase family 39 protein [Rhodospirillales bacterium]